MNTKTENYRDLRAKAKRMNIEIADLERRVADPANFSKRGELPHSTHIGWTSRTAWFYTPAATKTACERRQAAAIDKLPRLRSKRERALAKAARLWPTLPWADRATLIIVGAAPD